MRSDKIEIHSQGLMFGFHGWQYADPRAEDYQSLVDFLIGEDVTFAVYYADVAICGRHGTHKFNHEEKLQAHRRIAEYVKEKNNAEETKGGGDDEDRKGA